MPKLLETTRVKVGALTAGILFNSASDREGRLKKGTASDGTILTNSFDGGGLRRSKQEQGQKPVTYIWDGSDYLGEYNS